MSLRPPAAPTRLGAESAAVAGAALVLSVAALRARPAWLDGVVGHGDAWQNLWNLHLVDRALRSGASLLSTDWAWAPEGTSLLSHTLALSATVPGALLGRLVGFSPAYALLVVASFVLCAVASYRLARRLGAPVAGAALGAAVFAFAPQRFARSLGHLNLLGSFWIPFALEGLLVAARSRGRGRAAGAVLAALALVGLVLTDWYLALLGLLAVLSFSAFELARAPKGQRGGVFLALSLAALLALLPTLPLARRLVREQGSERTGGHPSKWCSVAVTSLVVPSRIQLSSALTRPLTERNHQNVAEGAGYLGVVPLALTLLVLLPWRRRPRDLDFALLAGGVALVLALGPQPRVFDRLLDFPLPYAWLERAWPPLALGGCVNRFVLLAFLPLALGTALSIGRLSEKLAGRRLGAAVALASLLLLVEYAPVDPGASTAPLHPPDPAMAALRAAPGPGAVLDVETGVGALVRQIAHGRPQTFGYLSRTPPSRREARLLDPLLGPLLDPGRPAAPLPRPVASALLRDRWGVGFVTSPSSGPLAQRARSFGFPLLYESGRSLVFRVPEEAPAPSPSGLDLGAEDLSAQGAATWGLHEAETVGLGDGPARGRWTRSEAELLVPLLPGVHRLSLAAPRPFPPRLVLRWGEGREAALTVSSPREVALAVSPSDRLPDGMVRISLRVEPAWTDSWERPLGVFLRSLSPSS